MATQAEAVDPSPLRHLLIRTPRLELRPDDDEGLVELAALAGRGAHPPDRMPFLYPWTDAPAHELPRNLLQHYWRKRAEIQPGDWTMSFLVRMGGTVVATQDIRGAKFGTLREVSTGSWVGRRYQGDGIGSEMRTALLLFAFDHLGAVSARSDAFTDNEASLAVSRKLGYVEDGTDICVPRGEPVVEQRLLLTRERFAGFRPDWALDVDRLDACLPMLVA